MVAEPLNFKDLQNVWLVFVLHLPDVRGIGAPSNL
jgi:hypothetical protein